jgi:nitroreductase
MEIQKALLNRRSIRKYKSQPISEENIDKILKAAMYAPSAMNTQAWQFVVIDDKKILMDILKIIPHAEMLKQTVKAILVCGDASVEKNETWILENCSAVTQNILLSSFGLGIGSCWISVYGAEDTVKKIKSLFNLPDTIIPFSLVSLGYPDEEVKTEDRFKKEKIHYNNW